MAQLASGMCEQLRSSSATLWPHPQSSATPNACHSHHALFVYQTPYISEWQCILLLPHSQCAPRNDTPKDDPILGMRNHVTGCRCFLFFRTPPGATGEHRHYAVHFVAELARVVGVCLAAPLVVEQRLAVQLMVVAEMKGAGKMAAAAVVVVEVEVVEVAEEV